MDRCVVRLHPVAAVLLLVVALTAAWTTLASAGAGGFPSNLAVLERLSLEALGEAVDSLRLDSREPVSILARSPHEANGFVLTRLAKILIDRGHEVTIVDAELAAADEPKAAAPAKSSPPPPPAAPKGAAATPPATKPIGALELDPDDPAAVGDTTGAYADSLALLVDPLWGEPLHPEAVAASAAAAKEREARAAAALPEARVDADEPADAGAPSPRIVTESDLTGLPAGHIVELKIQEFGVSYADVGRRMVFGPVAVTRVAGCYLELTHLIGPAGSLRRMSAGERHWVDRLGGSDRVLAEGAGYPFTRPELKPPSLGKYVEPAVVVGVVGSLIYLFYANQN